MRFWSPHYLYVPLAFAAMLLAEAVDRRKTAAVRVAFAATAILAAITLRDGLRYRNDESFFGPEVLADPRCREAHFYLGEAAREASRFDEAATHYQQALTPATGVLSYVDRGAALQNLGVLQLQQEKFEDARATFRTALGADVDEKERRKLTHNLATAELRSGNATEAARLLESEVERPDAMPASIFIRARAVRELGRGEEADALFRRLKAMAPAPAR